jgi:hypothetical protein
MLEIPRTPHRAHHRDLPAGAKTLPRQTTLTNAPGGAAPNKTPRRLDFVMVSSASNGRLEARDGIQGGTGAQIPGSASSAALRALNATRPGTRG